MNWWTCDVCGALRPAEDFAEIEGRSLCHPAWSSGETCYMRAQYAAAAVSLPVEEQQ